MVRGLIIRHSSFANRRRQNCTCSRFVSYIVRVYVVDAHSHTTAVASELASSARSDKVVCSRSWMRTTLYYMMALLPHAHPWNAMILLSLTTTSAATSHGVTRSCASTVLEVLVKMASWMRLHLLCGTPSFHCAQHAARQEQCLWHVGSAPMVSNAQSDLPESRADRPAALNSKSPLRLLPLLLLLRLTRFLSEVKVSFRSLVSQ